LLIFALFAAVRFMLTPRMLLLACLGHVRLLIGLSMLLQQCTALGAEFPKPRAAALYLGKLGPPEELRAVARFDFVVTNLYGSRSRMQEVIAQMRDANPALQIASYTVLVEMRTKADLSDAKNHPAIQAVTANDWWLGDASGRRTQWTDAYGTDLVNVTTWTKKDPDGLRWPQWLARHHSILLGSLTGLDYIYVDNVWYMPRPRNGAMDWKRNGSVQPSTDPDIQAAFRHGIADYWTALRQGLPGKKIIGNADNDLSYPEFKGRLEGAFLECMMGKSWSLERRRGWDGMMTVYRSALANTAAPHDVVLQVCNTDAVDHRQLRFGLASAMLEDGWFAYTVTGLKPPFFADEYSAPIGKPVERPPKAASPSGIWLRRYANGMVLVNPGPDEASIQIEAGYRRLSGKQDPTVNNGQAVRSVKLGARDGLLLVKQ
jgi:hypothetical protein